MLYVEICVFYTYNGQNLANVIFTNLFGMTKILIYNQYL